MNRQIKNLTGKTEIKNKNQMDGESVKWHSHFGKLFGTFL